MKILNVDEFAEVKRQIKYKGAVYDVEEVSVQQFIDNLVAAEKIEKEKGSEASLSQSFTEAVEAIRQSIPTFPEEEIRKMKIPGMTAVMKFIRGDLDPEATAPEGQTAEGAEAKK